MDSSVSPTLDDQQFTADSSVKSNLTTGDKSQDGRVTVLRPRSPTKCITGERGQMEFVERGIKDEFNSGVTCPWEDSICAFSATFLRSSSGSFVPDVDMHMYWCNFCPFKTKEKAEMIVHSTSHRFKCNYCDEEYFTRSDVVKHSIRKHPEYKLTRNALKACMLLRDLHDQDETSIISGDKNNDTDDKSDSIVHDHSQQSKNSDHGNGSSSSGGDFENQNSQTAIKISDTYSLIPSSKKDLNEESTTLPLEITNMRSLVGLTPSLSEFNTNENLANSESHQQDTSTEPITLITNIRSNIESSGNNANMIRSLISSTDETDLRIVDVQSANTFNPDIYAVSSVEENHIQSFDGSVRAPVSQQVPATEIVQLLETLNSNDASQTTKEIPRIVPEYIWETYDRKTPTETRKRKAGDENSSDEDEEEDDLYEPKKVKKTGAKRGPKPKRGRKPANKKIAVIKKSVPAPKTSTKTAVVSSLKKKRGRKPANKEDTSKTKITSEDNGAKRSTRTIPVTPVKQKRGRKPSNKEVSVKNKSLLEDNFNVDDLPVDVPFFRCVYCQFHTLKENNVQMHQKEKHSEKPSRYTRLIVNSNREVLQDTGKQSGLKNQEIAVKPSLSASSLSRVKTPSDNDEKEVENRYVCMFCDLMSTDVQVIRQHMFRIHPSKKLCCIDSVLKQKTDLFYTFFCCRHKCNFLDTDPQKYIDHVEKCTPLPKANVVTSKPTGLQQTVHFAKRLQKRQ